MTRTFTEDADTIVVQAYEHAIRLGHPYLGGEHLLLALAAADQPAGTVLSEHGVTPGRAGCGRSRYRRRERDDRGVLRPGGSHPRRPGRPPQAPLVQPRPAAFTGRDGAYLPLGPGAGQAFQRARREARARGATQPFGVEDLALGILAVSEGLAPPILPALACPDRH